MFRSCLLSLLLLSALQAAEPVDRIVTAGHVVTMDGSRRVIENGAVAIRGERIVAAGTRAEIDRDYTGKERVDEPRSIIAPGLINTHTHAPMALLRGIADDLALQEWLEKYIFPAEAKNVSREFVRDGTRLACLEMLLGGTTLYADMYYFEEVIAETTAACGMRGVLGQTVIGFPAPDAKTPDEALQRAEAFLKAFAKHPLIVPAVAPHAIYTTSEATLKASRALANKYRVPLLIHLSETAKENQDTQAKHSATPTAVLSRWGIFDGRTLAAHAVHLSTEDIRTLAQHRVGVAHCPSSNMMLASGTAPVPELLRSGVDVGLGTDGPAGSNNDLNLFEEMDLAAKLAKAHSGVPTALTAKQVVEMATIGGARAMGLAQQVGSIEAGKKADLIVVSTDRAHAQPLYDAYSALVYSLKASDVQHVMINGRVVVRDRQALTLDRAAVLQSAAKWRTRVLRSLGK